MTRCVVIVLGSGGIGAFPDAAVYAQRAGANTVRNVAVHVGGVPVPNFERSSSGRRISSRVAAAIGEPTAFVARLGQHAKGKDTITRHWTW